MEDLVLRCNALTCREQLLERAVVTTCSHIFCDACASASGLASAANSADPRICPACKTQLMNRDDAVLTYLKPADDYKTSLLSGLSPTIIMECAARGLAFWSYQTGQEVKYQTYLGQSLAERYQALSDQTDQIVQDANHELKKMEDHVQGFQGERASLLQKNTELQGDIKEKNKKITQLNKMYHVLKDKEMLAQVQDAACDNADHTILSARGQHHHNRLSPGMGMAGTLGMSRLPLRAQGHQLGGGPPSVFGSNGPVGRRLQSLSRGMPPPQQTPSDHRTRLPVPQRRTPSRTPSLTRQPLGPIGLNSVSRSNAGHMLPKLNIARGRQSPAFPHSAALYSTGFQ